MDNKKDTIIDFLHKSKIAPGFLEETKPSTASSTIDDCSERRRVSTTKSPTRLTYAGSLLKDKKENPKEIGGFKGQEPTTYGDWQHKGRVSDF